MTVEAPDPPQPEIDADGLDHRPQHYSKDYWDLVFEQLSRRKLFKLGLAVLTLLYATAIYAPLIANDRPFVLEAIDYREYKSALRSLSAVSSAISRLVKQTPEEFLSGRSETSPPTLADALALEVAAAEDRVETMRGYLDDEVRAPLDEYRSSGLRSTGRVRCAPLAMRSWIRWASRWNTSTGWARLCSSKTRPSGWGAPSTPNFHCRTTA